MTQKKQSIFCHIVAASTNNVIGLQNKLPWNIPEDLQFFRNKTKNAVIIMGRKTFESLGKPLPHRFNIILSRNSHFTPQNCLICTTIEKALEKALYHCDDQLSKEIFIIGGEEIYKQTLHLVKKIYLTRIHKNYEGDSFYPSIPTNQFKLTHRIDKKADPSYCFLTYEKY